MTWPSTRAAGLFYVTNYGDNTVSVINKASNAIVATVPVGVHPVAVEVDPVTHRAYVVNGDSTVSVIAPFASQDITFTSVAADERHGGRQRPGHRHGRRLGQPGHLQHDQPACTSAPAVRSIHPRRSA